ncbi:unnamed protein product [Sphagnum jensenii]|uniref:Uncharacterized protein n=1 Tax=Sphagnum jensenii TaxID=128206 RepID=A0ABP0VA24_9BRYO
MADKRMLMPVKLVDASGSTSPNQLAVPVTGAAVANATAGGILSMGSDGSNYRVLSTDTTGKLNINSVQSGTWNITNISGTISLPTGAATSANQTSLISAIGSTTSGQSGTLAMGATTTAAPTYTTAQTNPLSLTTAGALRVDGSAVTQPVSGTFWQATQPVSGTVTANAGTGTFAVSGTVTANVGTTNGLALDASVGKLNIAQGAATGSNTGPLIQGVVTSAAPTYTTATINPLSLDTAGNLRVNVVAGGGSSGVVAQSSATSGESGMLIQGAVTTAAPTYTTGNTNPLSLTTAGAIRVDGSATTQPVSGTVTANAGTGTFAVSGTVTANVGTGTMSVTGTGSAGTPAAGIVTIQGNASGTPVPVTGVFTDDLPTTPATTVATSAAVAAGASATLSTATSLISNYLWGIDIASSVAWKAVINIISNNTTTATAVVFGQSGQTIQWRPASRKFFATGGAGTVNGYSVVITNQDTSDAADVYATFYTALS